MARTIVWHKVLDSSALLPECRVKTVKAGKTNVCLTHYQGKFSALQNKCPHQGGPLGEGSIENGMLPEEQQANSRYFYELASAKFGWDIEKVKNVQAFHFKGGQGAKTGTSGHLPSEKVV